MRPTHHFFADGARTEAAFTLIEVLLAVTISAIVLAAINVVFFGAIRLREGSAVVTEKTLPLDQLVSVMKRDLRGIVPPDGVLAGIMASDTTAVGMNQPVLLEIYTATGQLVEETPFGDIQRIDYALQDSTNRMAGARAGSGAECVAQPAGGDAGGAFAPAADQRRAAAAVCIL